MRGDFYPKVVSGKQNLVLLGEAGSGKSEIALNLAELLVSKGWPVHLYDLDQTKPLFRSRDAREKLERLGVVMHWEDQLLDAPVITGGVRESLLDGSICSILDIGGFETGARMIGRFSEVLEQTGSKALYLVNPYRPWTKDADNLLKTMVNISRATRLQEFHVLANPHLGPDTTAEEFLEGLEMVEDRIPEGLTLEGACVREALAREVEGQVEIPLLPIKLNLSYEWRKDAYLWEK